MSLPIPNQVRAIAAEVFDLAPDQVRDDTAPANVPHWDSVQHLNFVLALEARLGIQFHPEEIEQLQSIGDAIRVVEAKIMKR
jgi:acyl carrier protein